jgi:hypothetical protein
MAILTAFSKMIRHVGMQMVLGKVSAMACIYATDAHSTVLIPLFTRKRAKAAE